jgi:hypothetical protein
MFLRGSFPCVFFLAISGDRLSNAEVRLEIYGRFMGGSDRNRSNSGRPEQYVQHMQIVQSRINTGYFASR